VIHIPNTDSNYEEYKDKLIEVSKLFKSKGYEVKLIASLVNKSLTLIIDGVDIQVGVVKKNLYKGSSLYMIAMSVDHIYKDVYKKYFAVKEHNEIESLIV